jgi:hypothetical protein
MNLSQTEEIQILTILNGSQAREIEFLKKKNLDQSQEINHKNQVIDHFKMCVLKKKSDGELKEIVKNWFVDRIKDKRFLFKSNISNIEIKNGKLYWNPNFRSLEFRSFDTNSRKSLDVLYKHLNTNEIDSRIEIHIESIEFIVFKNEFSEIFWSLKLKEDFLQTSLFVHKIPMNSFLEELIKNKSLLKNLLKSTSYHTYDGFFSMSSSKFRYDKWLVEQCLFLGCYYSGDRSPDSLNPIELDYTIPLSGNVLMNTLFMISENGKPLHKDMHECQIVNL